MMLDYPNAVLSDSLERELLRQETSFYNASPLLDLARYIGRGVQKAQAGLASLLAAVPANTGSAGQKAAV